MKSINTLGDDIYELVTTKEVAEGVDLEKCIDDFGENMKSLMRKEFTEKRDDTRKLRMSNIGREDRFLWNVYNDVDKVKTYSHTRTSSSSTDTSLKNYYCSLQELQVTR